MPRCETDPSENTNEIFWGASAIHFYNAATGSCCKYSQVFQRAAQQSYNLNSCVCQPCMSVKDHGGKSQDQTPEDSLGQRWVSKDIQRLPARKSPIIMLPLRPFSKHFLVLLLTLQWLSEVSGHRSVLPRRSNGAEVSSGDFPHHYYILLYYSR